MFLVLIIDFRNLLIDFLRKCISLLLHHRFIIRLELSDRKNSLVFAALNIINLLTDLKYQPFTVFFFSLPINFMG